MIFANQNLINLKILSIFVIFLCGGIGTALPNLLNTQSNNTIIALLFCKIFSAGIILGTGFVHLLPDSENSFNFAIGKDHYPFTGFIAGLACIMLMIIEQCINRLFSFQNKPEINHNINYGSIQQDGIDCINIETGSHHDNHHCHQINILHEDTVSLKKLITVYILEIGIAIHSIMIGITMGSNSDEGSFISLLIALILHQFFEGVALGASISRASILNIQKIIMMILFFSVITPFGIFIGLIINNSYDSNSKSSYLIQGIFNALSAGILIYMALIHLIIEDFNNNEINFGIKIIMFILLFCGFAITSIIAIWV